MIFCLCMVGFTGPDGGICRACGAGKYKTIAGSSKCSYCEAGKFSGQTGRSSGCDLCSLNTFSAEIGANSSKACTSCPEVVAVVILVLDTILRDVRLLRCRNASI